MRMRGVTQAPVADRAGATIERSSRTHVLYVDRYFKFESSLLCVQFALCGHEVHCCSHYLGFMSVFVITMFVCSIIVFNTIQPTYTVSILLDKQFALWCSQAATKRYTV